MVKQTELVAALSDETGFTLRDCKLFLDSLERITFSEISNGEKVKIGKIVQLEPKLKPPTKRRKGRNPRTGEEVMVSAKPAKVALKARALVGAKKALPSIAKFKKAQGL